MKSPLEKLKQFRAEKEQEEAKTKEEVAKKEAAELLLKKQEEEVAKKTEAEKKIEFRASEWDQIQALEEEAKTLGEELRRKNLDGIKEEILDLKGVGQKTQKEGKEAIQKASPEEVDLLRKDAVVREEVFGEQIKKLKEINKTVRGKKAEIKEAEPLQEKIKLLQEKIKILEDRPSEEIAKELQQEADALREKETELKEKIATLEKERNTLGFTDDEYSLFRDYPDDKFVLEINKLKEEKKSPEEIKSFIEQYTQNPTIKRFAELYANWNKKIEGDFKYFAQHQNFGGDIYHDPELEKLRKRHKEIPKEIENIKKELEETTKKIEAWRYKKYVDNSEARTKERDAKQAFQFSQAEIKETQKKIDFYKDQAPEEMKKAEEYYLNMIKGIEAKYDEKVQANIENVATIFEGKEKTAGSNYWGLEIPKKLPIDFFEKIPTEVKSFETLIDFLKKKKEEAEKLKEEAERSAKDVGFFTKKAEKEEKNERAEDLSKFCTQFDELIQKYEGFKQFNQKERDEKIEERREILRKKELEYGPKTRVQELNKLEEKLKKDKEKFFSDDEKLSQAKAFWEVSI